MGMDNYYNTPGPSHSPLHVLDAVEEQGRIEREILQEYQDKRRDAIAATILTVATLFAMIYFPLDGVQLFFVCIVFGLFFFQAVLNIIDFYIKKEALDDLHHAILRDGR